MKLYIPEIGDELTLSADWNFSLYSEYRNEKLMAKLNWKFEWRYTYGQSPEQKQVTIPNGTVLKVDRIYIRKGNKEYSSLTFYIKNGPWKGARFWAKLSDVNTIEFTSIN